MTPKRVKYKATERMKQFPSDVSGGIEEETILGLTRFKGNRPWPSNFFPIDLDCQN